MYRVDFVDKLNYSLVHHSINSYEGLDDIKLSGEKIAGDDYFAREPQRLEFTCLEDDWLKNNIFDGDNEQIRNISNYEIRLYENNVLRFHGIIDTSFCSYNSKTYEMRFTCYDKLRLLVKFSDLTKLYSRMDGYIPGYCFAYFAQGIEGKIANRMPVHWSSYTPLAINVTNTEILKIKWKEIIEKFGSNVYVPSFGFKTTFYGTKLILALKQLNQDPDTDYYSAKVYACEWKFYNNICPYLDESTIIDEETIESNDHEIIHALVDDILGSYLDDVPESYNTTAGIFSVPSLDSYGFPPMVNPDTCEEFLSVSFTGNAIPAKLFPKGFYDQNGEQSEMLAVLKSALLLHNLTLVSDSIGHLWLRNKEASSVSAISILDKDVIEFEEKRRDWEAPDTSVLEILMGETEVLQKIVKDHYSDFLAFKWELTTTIDGLDNYNIQLFDRLAIRGKEYKVSELKRDPIEDEYQILAWRIN